MIFRDGARSKKGLIGLRKKVIVVKMFGVVTKTSFEIKYQAVILMFNKV